jgi:hypothetical protein
MEHEQATILSRGRLLAAGYACFLVAGAGLLQSCDLAVVLSGGTGLLVITEWYPPIIFAATVVQAFIIVTLVQVLRRHYGVQALTAFALLFMVLQVVSSSVYVAGETFMVSVLRQYYEWAYAPGHVLAMLFGVGLFLPQYRLPIAIRVYGLSLVLTQLLMNQWVFDFSQALIGPWMVTVGGFVNALGDTALGYAFWRERQRWAGEMDGMDQMDGMNGMDGMDEMDQMDGMDKEHKLG